MVTVAGEGSFPMRAGMTSATLDGPATAVATAELPTAALAGGAAPAELGGRYRRIADGSIDDRGGFALSVELVGSSVAGAVVLLLSGGAARVVARAGDPAPGGGRFRAFRELDLADGGLLLFRAELDGSAATEGLFLRTADGAVAPVGAAAEYVAFGQPTVVATGAGPVLAFVGRLADGRACVVQHPPYQRPAVALRSGPQPAGEVIENDLVISRLGMGLCCIARVRSGDRRFTQALAMPSGEWLRTGAELPGRGRIARLLTPPAMCGRLGFVTVGLDGGGTALCSRPSVLADPMVLAASGDPVPGLGDQRIARIGAPVTNSGTAPANRVTNSGNPVANAASSPCGVACPIRLSSGRPALWVGVFGGDKPTAVVPWLDGVRAAERPDLAVSRLTPVKLGNDGTLLLRALVGDAGERRTSLLVLSGLFG